MLTTTFLNLYSLYSPRQKQAPETIAAYAEADSCFRAGMNEKDKEREEEKEKAKKGESK